MAQDNLFAPPTDEERKGALDGPTRSGPGDIFAPPSDSERAQVRRAGNEQARAEQTRAARSETVQARTASSSFFDTDARAPSEPAPTPEQLATVQQASRDQRAIEHAANIEAARRGEVKIVADDNYLDRARASLAQTGGQIFGGLGRAAAAITPEGTPGREAALELARRGELVSAAKIDGKTTWEDVKANPWLYPSLIADELPGALAYSGMMVSGLGVATVGGSFAGNIAQDRAQNDGRLEAGAEDVAIAAPFAAGSVAAEKIGSKYLFGGAPTGGVATRIGKAAVAEGVTEGAQSLIEGLGGSIGTQRGVQAGELLDQVAAGVAIGAGTGGAIRAGTETAGAAVDQTGRLLRRRDDRPAPAGMAEVAASAAAQPTQADIDSPLDTQDIVAGRAEVAAAEASNKVDGAARGAGLPGVGERVAFNDPETGTVFGTVRDYSEDGGVVIEPENGGRLIREYLDTLSDLGITITPAPLQDAALPGSPSRPEDPDPAEAPSPDATPPQGAEGGGVPSGVIRAKGKPGAVANVLTEAGYSNAVVAGFLGNFEVEGGYGGARGDGGSASGIAQWRLDRRDNFRRQYGKDPHEATPEEQAAFVVWEMQNPRAAGMTEAQRDRILAAKTPEEAAQLIDQFYERSDGRHRDRRAREARRFAGETTGPADTADSAPAVSRDDRTSMLDVPVPEIGEGGRREAVQPDMLGGPDLTESEVAAREAVDGVLEQARQEAEEEGYDLDLPAVVEGLRTSRANFNRDRSGIPNESLADFEGITRDTPNALIDAAQANPAIIEALAERAGLPQAAGSVADPAPEVALLPEQVSEQGAERAARQTEGEETANATATAPEVSFADSSSGKGLIVTGLSDAQLEMLKSTVPQAKATPRRASDGAVTYSKKHEAAIRAALAGEGQRDPSALSDGYRLRDTLSGVIIERKDGSMVGGYLAPPGTSFSSDLRKMAERRVKKDRAQKPRTPTVEQSSNVSDDRPSGPRVIINKVGRDGLTDVERGGPLPSPEQAPPAPQPTNQDMLRAAQESGRLEIVDARSTAPRANTGTPRRQGELSWARGDRRQEGATNIDPADRIEFWKGWDTANLAAPVEDAGERAFRDALLAGSTIAEAREGNQSDSTPTPAPARFAKNKLFTEDKVAAAEARIRERMKRLNSGIDPEFITDGMIIAGAHIENGVRNFAEYASKMREAFGNEITPYLLSFWEAARNYPGLDTKDMTPPDVSRAMAELIQNQDKQATSAPDAATGGGDADVSTGLRDRDGGESAEGVRLPSQDRGATGASGQEGGGSARDVRDADQRPADTAERGAQEPGGRSGSARAGVRGADRVPAENTGSRNDAGRRDPADRVTGEDWVIEPGSLAENRSWMNKARDNIAAIETVKQIKAEQRPATRAEQALLARYVGWGGLANIFPDTEGRYGKGFEEMGPRLRELLTDEEYATARQSTQYAHYTGEAVVRSMWAAATRLGFRGGAVFEPGMGTGNFVGMMPGALKQVSAYSGIEFDGLTADIAKALYPKSGVRQADYTDMPVGKGVYDLVIGNPPFSATTVTSDPEYGARKFVLHDFFFAKSIDAVKPGGLLMFVTSAGTMNKVGTKAREFLAERADLVGAIRLPGDAFKQNAGTNVTTDIIILRKRAEGEARGSDAWINVEPVQMPGRDGETVEGNVNRYFIDNPDMILGEQGMLDKLVAGPRYAVRVRPGQDFEQTLNEAVRRLPEGVIDTAPTGQSPEAQSIIDTDTTETKDGSYYVADDGTLMQYRQGVGQPVKTRGAGVKGGLTKTDQQKVKMLVPVRDALREVYRADLAEDAAAADAARAALNKSYDAFVKKFGPINLAKITPRSPTPVQIEKARLEAREDERLAGRPWDDGSFDLEPWLEKEGVTATDIAKAREAAKAEATARGEKWEEGTFEPSDVEVPPLEKKLNLAAFAEDPESYRLGAIERYNKETGEATKGQVFFENVVSLDRKPSINSVGDALLYSLNRFGAVNMAFIAEEAGVSRSEAIEQLGDKVFELPGAPGTFETAESYLSGNVRKKLAIAQEATAKDERYQRNVEALRNALPPDLTSSEITASLGMPWLPQEVIQQFARNEMKLAGATVEYSAIGAKWGVEGNKRSSAAVQEWGTEDINAVTLLEKVLNRAEIKVTRTVDNGSGGTTQVIDEAGTQAVKEKASKMREAFEQWVYSEPAREAELVQLYNERFNNLVAPKYSGEFLTTPGINSSWSWRPHQRAVIARVIQSGNTYMAHEVGAGKTSAMIGSGMEMRRLGLWKKPMYVVPNHMLGQFTKEFYEQYPLAKILVADDKRFHNSRRKEFIATAAANDLDAIIITHSGFGFIPLSNERMAKFIAAQLAEVEAMLKETKGSDSRFTRKQIEAQKEQLAQQLKAMNKRKDQVFTFEEMGVDAIIVDEAHLFRKLNFTTSMGATKGIDPNGSKMSLDLYAKTRYLEDVNPGRGIVFASGTPITNTMAEIFSVSRYLQQDTLAERGLDKFDAWAGSFGQTETDLEQGPDGNYRAATRFTKFVNAVELSTMVRQVMDVVTANDLRKYVTLPELKGGKRQLLAVPQTDNQADYQAELARRFEAIQNRRGPPKKGDDILLSVIGDGRKAAIDYRLIDPNAPREEGTKLERLIENVYQRHKQFEDVEFFTPLAPGEGYSKEPAMRGPATQIIFSDLGINGDFPVHKYIKRELVRRQIPASEIALMSDYKSTVAKQRLFNDMNEGKVRILIGSVPKMGTGVNAQKRMRALHNLDAQWYPANDTQRNGRIMRQGNLNPEIEIIDYSTEGTYDSQMWGLMAKKAGFIEAFMRGDPNMRTIEDLGEASQYEQAKAMTTSDPRIIELTEWEQEYQRLERQKIAAARSARSKVLEAQYARDLAQQNREKLATYEKAAAQVDLPAGDAFTAQVSGETFDNATEFGEALLAAIDAEANELGDRKEMARKVGRFGGFDIGVETRKVFGSIEQSMVLALPDGLRLDVEFSDSARGTVTRLENAVKGITARVETTRTRIAEQEARAEEFDNAKTEEFTGDDRMVELQQQIDDLKATLAAESAAREDARKARQNGQTPNSVAEDGDGGYDPGDGQEPNPQSPLRRDPRTLPPSQGRLRGLGIASEIEQAGAAALVGREAADFQDIADLAQVYRDPRYETFRVFFMRGREIVHATAVTARLPDQAPLLPKGLPFEDFAPWLRHSMKDSGADGYYLLHNHPSGDPTPGDADKKVTAAIAREVPGFKGHVVINSNRYAHITAGGKARVFDRDYGNDKLLTPSMRHPLLGTRIANAYNLADAAKMVQGDGMATVIGIDAKGGVRLVIDYPVDQLTRAPKILLGRLRGLMRRSGSADLFLVADKETVQSDVVRGAVEKGVLLEAMDQSGAHSNTVTRRKRGEFIGDYTVKSARAVREEGSAYTPAQPPSKPEAIILAGKDPTWKGKMAEAYNGFRRAAQDRYLPLLRVQRDIELRQGGPLPEDMNPYVGEELSAGRIGSRLEELMEERVRPLFEAMHEEGVTHEELETYLYARHAPERNARMSEINPDFDDGEGSGMTDREARAIMARIQRKGQMDAMKRLAARVDAMIEEALERRVEYGLLSESEAREWKETYEHYIPLRGFREIEGHPDDFARINRSGGGINVRGKESRTAFGRRSEADSPLTYVILQAEEAIVRGETNRVAQRFVELARANPDETFWKVNKSTAKRRINPDTGLVENYLVHQLTAEDKDWTVVAKFDGKERRVTMNRANPEARALADAMRNLTQHQLDFVTKYLGVVNRFLSRVNTSYNPEFIISNALRDIQTAALNLTATERDGLATAVLKDYRKALVASTKGAWGKMEGEWGQTYRDFIEDGGRVYFNQVEDVGLIKKRLERTAEQVRAANGEKNVQLQAKRYFRAAIEAIENTNLGVENAVRLAAYKNAREMGMSRESAASLAKNLTVNFNRRGTFGPVMNALYLFFNASIQGSVRMFQAMKSRRLQKVLGGVVVGAAMLELLNSMITGDDDDGESHYDKIPGYEKRRNMIIMIGEKDYIKIPLPYGYNLFWDTGRSMAEIARRGGDRWLESASSPLTTALESFNPIGFDFEGRTGWEAFVSLAAPSAIDPIVDLSQNRDFTGRPIMPEQSPYGVEGPEHQRYFAGVSPIWREVASFMNDATGGDDVIEGAVSVSPEALEHLAGTVVGAAGAFVDRAFISAPAKAMDPEFDFDVSDVPFARKALGTTPRWYDKSAYYERIEAIEGVTRNAKDYLDREQFDSAQQYARANRIVLSLAPVRAAAERDMRKIRKARRENEGAFEKDRIDKATYDQQRSAINEAEEQVITRFNTIWNQTVGNRREFGAQR